MVKRVRHQFEYKCVIFKPYNDPKVIIQQGWKLDLSQSFADKLGSNMCAKAFTFSDPFFGNISPVN